MDLPQYLHHHPRYATSSSSPSEQQQQPNYPNYPHRNYHHHHHHHNRTSPPQNPPQLRPSLPPPPQSQSQSPPALYKTLPPPSPPPPQITTFSPRPIDSDHHHHQRTTFSPRANHHRPQPPPDSDRPRHRLSQQFVYHHRDRDRDRDRERERSRNNYSPRRDYDDRDSHKPYRRDDGGGGVRFRSDYNEQRDHHHHRRADDESYPPRRRSSNHHETTSFREVVEFQSSPNNMSSGGVYDESAYEELLRSGRRYENYEIQRWGLERPEVAQVVVVEEQDDDDDEEEEEEDNDLYDPFELDEREVEDYYESSSGRRVTASRWKQIQKKSALLRLQNPKLRDRSHSAYFDTPGPSGVSFRGKEQQQYEYSGHGRDEQLEEQRRDCGGGGGGSAGSPLDLDVSFNGNSLVAKTVRTRDCLGSPQAKLTKKNVVNLDNSPQKEVVRLQGEGSSSGMNVQLSSVVTDDAFVVKSEVGRPAPSPKGKSLQKDDMDSKLCSVVTADAFVKSEVERTPKGKTLPKNGKNVGSIQKSSPNLPKKTKVVKKMVTKKIVKKVTKPTLQMKSKIDEAGTSSAHSSIAGTGKVEALPISEPSPNSLPVSKKVDYVSDEHSTVLNSCNENIGDDSTATIGSSSPEPINADQTGPLNADTPVKGLLTVSNANSNVSDTVRVAPCHEIGDVVDVSKSICQSGDNSSVDNVGREETSQAILPVESNLSFGTLNSGKMQEHMIGKGSDHGVETSLDLDNDITLSHPDIMVHDVGTVDAINEQPSRYQLPMSVQNVGELPMAISAADSNSVGLSNSGETKAVHTRIGRRSRWDSDEVYVKRDQTITVSNGGNVNSLDKRPYSNCASKSFEISKSVGDTNSVTPMIQKKRKVMTQSDFSSMSNTCVEPVDASVKSALDTTVSTYLKDSSPGEVVSGVQKLDMDSESGNDGVSALNGKSLVNGFCETKLSDKSYVNYDTNETSPEDNGSHLVLSTFQTNTGPAADKSTYYTQESLTRNDVPIDQVELGASSSLGSECATSKLIPSHEEINVFLENIMATVSPETLTAARDAVINDDMKFKHEGVVSSSVSEEPGIPQTEIPCPSELRNEEKDDDLEVIVDIMEVDGSFEKDLHFTATNEQVISRGETAPCTIHSELQPADSGKHSSSSHMDMDSEYVYVKDKLPLVSNCFATDNEVSTTNSSDGGTKSVPDTLSDTGIQETFSSVTDMLTLTCNPSVVNNLHEKACGDDQQFDLNTVVASAETLFSETKTNLTLDHATEGNQPVSGKTIHLKLQDSKKTSHGPHLISAESALKNHLGLATRRIVPGRSISSFTASQKTTSSTHVSKPRTWHRNANSSASSLPASVPISSTYPPQRQLPQRNGSDSNSYVRKGNTLVRKFVPAAVPQSSQGLSSSGYQLSSSSKDGLKKNAGSDSGAVIKKSLSLMRTVGINAPSDRASASLPSGSKVSTSAAISSGNSTLSPITEHNGLLETSSDPMNTLENKEREGSVKDSLGTPDSQENHTDPGNNQPDENLASSNVNKITYVKRKLNQLVASENVSDLSVHSVDNNQPSEGYYKRRKHQLIRSSLESKQMVLLPTDNFNSGVQRARKVLPSRTFNKQRSLKAVARMIKKNSLVWTPSGTQSSNNNGSSFAHQKVLPHLFPWKRARYWRTFRQSQASNFNYTSPSTISKKLLLSRMRDTVYTRSTHGFSLKKYKVLSVGGSSLKWSKSIESRSKKVNEEATRAVAEVEKKKREHNGAACTSSGSKIRNNSPGKRIFRIGSVRYKMDPSRRTLKRISDDESTSSSVLNPEKDIKRSYVPRRLVIGNDEYVRIGNGNKLIRDPKKRTRILASERVRWSLHTARQRLAKKRKYCQFFTRFGKCNKDDGKCPYIHDPSKIAVCTKFLNGLCSNSNCKLTHKVIPERMPDCSFFLQGLCTNKNCSYRHVNVNPKATTCEGFLKGYCADGNECRKKHSYVCQIFEETGACPQGATCKLHHPKKRTKGKIKKRSREHKNGWGRYFVSKDVCISEPVIVSARHCTRNGDDIFGNEFISIDVSDEEAGEINNPPEQTTFYDSDPSELDLDDLDELIKPVGLLNKMKTNVI